MARTNIISFFIIICFFIININIQSQNIHFNHIDSDNGVISNLITRCIIQDSKGFMWFGAETGLYKYDGYKFTFFESSPGAKNGIGIGFVKSLCEDKNGKIWIGTSVGILNLYDPQSEEFIQFKNDPHDPYSIPQSEILCIYEDRKGIIWIGTLGNGLLKLFN